MRPTNRLWAAVKSLQPGQPTGLTGLLSHPAPRSTLMYLYSSTLKRLEQFPESSVYRQSLEALTKKRLAIITAVKPEGYDAWDERIQYQLAEVENEQPGTPLEYNGQRFILTQMYGKEKDVRTNEYDGLAPFARNAANSEDDEMARLKEWVEANKPKFKNIEPEPLYSLQQIQQLETELEGGLIEEVIQVAQGENELVNIMAKNKIWEDLIEKSPEGQWSYFERN